MAKILIAEDNDLNLKLMYDILSSQGHEVDCATDGEMALESLLRKNYDLLLLDLQMPKLSGFDVMKEILKREIKIKIVVVSACVMSDEINGAKDLGCEEFIVKPIRLHEFLSTINRILS